MIIDVKKLFDYWYNESGYSWGVAESLFRNKKYAESLFFGHLAIEKILKAAVVSLTKVHSPRIHNLVELVVMSDIPVSKDQIERLRSFNEFYMAGRYDEDKMKFRKKCTTIYTKKNLRAIQELYLWLRKEVKDRYRPR